ncbi:MAG: Rft protein-domain-containing protein, partial [Olpidium bornovanus]
MARPAASAALRPGPAQMRRAAAAAREERPSNEEKQTGDRPLTAQASEILSSSVTGASYLVSLQLFTRMTTFALNQLLLRYVTPTTLGIASVQLELLLNTILFLSREGFRCALLRGATPDDSDRGTGTQDSDVRRRKDWTCPPSAVDGSTQFGAVQKIVNVGVIPLVLAVFVTTGVCAHYLRAPPDAGNGAPPPHYASSVILYGLASLIEIASEPLYVLAQLGLFFRARVAIEAGSVIVRCIVTLGLTLVGAGRTGTDADAENVYGVLSFAVAQFLVALVVTGGYVFFWIKRISPRQSKPALTAADVGPADPDCVRGLLPRSIWRPHTRYVTLVQDLARLPSRGSRIRHHSLRSTTYYFDRQLVALGSTLTTQSFLKHMLNEGDKIMITAFCSTHDQGVYAFVVNYGAPLYAGHFTATYYWTNGPPWLRPTGRFYCPPRAFPGSLVVRILFQPLEETGRMMFSKLLGPLQQPSLSLPPASEPPKPRSLSSQEAQLVITAARLLANSMKFHIILGLAFVGLATNHTGALIDLLVGPKWSRETDAPATLAAYCLYVPLMGVNGIAEAFVQAVASERELTRWSRAM